jgi:DNA-binding MarR family transcriptional regulator
MTDRAAAPRIPLPGLLDPLLARIRAGVVEAAHRAGFTDVREAHNPVFAFVPAEGIRVTELARLAGMSKQAMSELVNELVANGYFDKEPDPTDGRAKLIVWSDRAWQLDKHAQEYFDQLEHELAQLVGVEPMQQLRRTLERIVTSDVIEEPLRQRLASGLPDQSEQGAPEPTR